MILSRILLIPVIAAVGYEILRWGARHRGNPIVRVIMWPGILVQMITTKQPTEDMIEVAIVSMEQALKADGEELPADSAMLERDPMVLPGTTAAARRPRRSRGRNGHTGHDRSAAPRGMSVAVASEDLDARLTEVARQYDEVQAELALPETSTRSRCHPPAGSRARPPRAGRRRIPATPGHPRGARRRP